MVLTVVFLSLSLLITLSFFLYGFNLYYLLFSAKKYQSPPIPPRASAARPRVALHLPIYNEKYVIRRLVDACACMAEDYGMENVRILILDDSDDDTIQVVDQVVRDYQQKHFRIEVLRRASRQGFKAGALQAALEMTAEDFIAIFDADFIPPPDFLLRTLPYFVQDDRLGIIQMPLGPPQPGLQFPDPGHRHRYRCPFPD